MRAIDRLFYDLMSNEMGSAQQWSFSPACDVEETDSHYLVSFDLPGVRKEDVKIELKENQLMVSGERKSDKRDNAGRHIVERFHGSFQRLFTLPSTVDTDKVEAGYQDGVLRIAIPKAEAAKPRQIKISDGKTGFFGKLLETTSSKVAS